MSDQALPLPSGAVRQAVATHLVCVAAFMLRAAAILLLTSPILVLALLVI